MSIYVQDTVLFNESIQFNISYGRIGASLVDVQEVAALADIHKKVPVAIQSFDFHSFEKSRSCRYRTATTQKWESVV